MKDTTGHPLERPASSRTSRRIRPIGPPTHSIGSSSTDSSDAFIADWSQLYLGIRTRVQIQVLIERYADYGQVGFLAWSPGDVQVARPAAFDVTTGVRP